MFPVFLVPDHAATSPEQLGTKPKFWFEHEELGNCLFKEGRPNTGDDWSEKVSCELCELIGLPHANYHLAIWRGHRGVISPTFIPTGGALVHGRQLMVGVVTNYPGGKFFHLRQHTLRRVLAIMRTVRFKPPIAWQSFKDQETALDVFIGYLMLDMWIANQDRHHDNWSFVVTQDGAVHLAPSYDHASSLGSNETDRNRENRLKTRDRRRSVQRYVEKATSAFYRSSSDTRPIPTFDAFRDAGSIRPGAANAWIDRIERVSDQDTRQVFNKVPPDRITPVAIDFAQKMLEINRNRLLALRGVFK
jgi:hypothetical protein